MREYSGDTLRDMAIVFIVLETLAVALRFAAMRLSEKRLGIDDILTIPGYLSCVGLCILSLDIGRVGYHLDVVETVDPQALVPWAKCLYATPIIYSAGCCFPRVILLTLYLRICEKNRPYRVACYSLMAFIVAFAIADIMAGAFECWPVAYLWDKTIAGGKCDNIPVFYRWGTLPNVIIDLAMLILPQPVVWRLQVPSQVKYGLAVTFLTGSIGMLTSICRCVAFFTNNPLTDGTWISVTFLLWSVVEAGVYLIAACLPCYRPLLRLVTNRGRLTSVRSKYPTQNSTRSSAGRGTRTPEPDLELSPYLQIKADACRESDEQVLVMKGSK
ncbi:hypothetical protein BP00DRAFT_439626 [Aspergillus indologenus CBS 114.80]|uniref:Rhodopsin domain-containing protein n=1 Tax=Aspergillus indologenus CBS 114.80 TaxID=1450541 RepID=A0A2V5HXR7_9EURO|nr:hypothetical protein BP00DRAFT_439626 [Aspergillus indologenus CBS 114.80]